MWKLSFILCTLLSLPPVQMSFAQKQAPVRYEIIDLGAGVAYAINEKGSIRGQTLTNSGYTACVWRIDKKAVTAEIPGGSTSNLERMNARGDTIVSSRREKLPTVSLDQRSLLGGFGENVRVNWPVYSLWRDGKQYELFREVLCVADLNDRGQVIGWAMTYAKKDGYHAYAFIWEDGKIERIVRNEEVFHVSDINNKGQVVGSDSMGAFLWEKGKFTSLRLEAWRGVPRAINDAGVIIGHYGRPDQPQRAFVWEKGDWKDLGTLGGPYCEVAALNNKGHIVGSAATTRKDNEDNLELYFSCLLP